MSYRFSKKNPAFRHRYGLWKVYRNFIPKLFSYYFLYKKLIEYINYFPHMCLDLKSYACMCVLNL